jgi:pimeloyl-ACP methyl ester carboxylesterase
MDDSSLPARRDSDAQLLAAQAVWLERLVPGHRVSRITWEQGSTQLIELGPQLDEDGPPLLLIHGGLGEAFQWAPIMGPLARHRRVLAVDRPGHGLADPFDSRGTDFMAHAAGFIADVLEAAGVQRAALVGSSMGGLFATAFAHRHPERVAALVLQSPAGITRNLPTMLRAGMLPVLRSFVRNAMRKPTRDSMRSFWSELLVAHPERLPDEFLDLSALSQARNAESWFHLLDRTIGFWGFDRTLCAAARFEDLQVPTTFLWGDKDAFAPASCGDQVVKRNSHARMVRIPDAGHVPWFDQREATAQAILSAV